MEVLATTLSLIDMAIRLERECRHRITAYVNAPEDAEDLALFGSQFNADRLRYIKAIAENLRRTRRIDRETAAGLEAAVTRLNTELKKAHDYFASAEPNTTWNRLWWALRTAKQASKFQDDLHKRLDDIAHLLQLADHSATLDNSRLVPLKNPEFSPIGKPSKLDGIDCTLKRSLCHYMPYDAKLVEDYNADVHVIIEQLPATSSVKSAADIANLLRKSLGTHVNESTSYQAGLLPCLGYQEFPAREKTPATGNLIFLLPKNADVKHPPKSLQTVMEETRKPVRPAAGRTGSHIAITLEMRFGIALQLARAVHAIHVAGFSHCSLRSDSILFVQPSPAATNQQLNAQQVPAQSQVEPLEEQPAVIRRPTEKFAESVNALGEGLRRRFVRVTTGFAGTPKNQEATKEDKKAEKEQKKVTKASSIRGVRMNTGGSDSEQDQAPRVQRNAPMLKNSILGIGAIPPGGSVFLLCWRNIKDQTEGPADFVRKWYKDIYKHPQQQLGSRNARYISGHDIYGLGVCLLEIGLWEPFVLKQKEQGRLRMSEVLKSRGATETHGEAGWAEKMKTILVGLADTHLPGSMGTGYARVVQACLKCMDDDGKQYWGNDVDFRMPNTNVRTDEKRLQECAAFEGTVVSVLSYLSSGMSYVTAEEGGL